MKTVLIPDPLIIKGDRVQLEQVILNLVVIAIDALGEAGNRQRHIKVSTRLLDEDKVELRVSDNRDPEMVAMGSRLKFYGWGVENTGLDEAERERLFRFLADRLGIEPRLVAPPQMADISLREPRVTPPDSVTHVLTGDPYERLLHTYGKSYPETVRASDRDFANAPDLVALPAGRGGRERRARLGCAERTSPSFPSGAAPRSLAASSRPLATAMPASSASTCVGSAVSSRSTGSAGPRVSRPAPEAQRSRRR